MIGATPFRPESAGLLALSSRDSYYDSDEWQEWSDRIQLLAEKYDVTLIEGCPGQNHADGLWLGDSEPSGAYLASGDRDDIARWAAHVAGHYNQDAVMVLYADPDGKDVLYTFDPGQGSHGAEQTVAAMKAAEVPGGRLREGALEIVSTGDEPVSDEAVTLLRMRLGCQEDQVHRSPCTAAFIEKNNEYLKYSPLKDIQGIRQRHAEKHGLPVRGSAPHLTDADDIAASMAYETGTHDVHNPQITRSYGTLITHITEQHDALTAAGYTFEPWKGEQEQPYANSAGMLADLRDNKHLYYFRTEMSQDTAGALPADHPMAKTVHVHDKDGHPHEIVANDVFRAVHDAIAHSEGHQFGQHGEKMAWWAHRSSLPRQAHLALWNETRAQNVFTNAGPHMRTTSKDGTTRLLQKGEAGWLSLPDRPYAKQKCVAVPLSFV